jgi:hypothetical protein
VNGLDVSRVQAVITKRLAQHSDRLEQRRLRDERVLPYGVDELLLGDHRAGIADERAEERERTRRQRYLVAAAPQAVAWLEAKRSEPYFFGASCVNVQDFPVSVPA